MFDNVSEEYPVIGWWSGGAASAVTCKLCIDWFGVKKVMVILIGTRNEDDDTERFRLDCEKWYGAPIHNCLKTGCVQGGIGYWQKYQVDFPDKFDEMAAREHDYTNKKGAPVTICKDQSKDAKARNGGKAELVFLKPHPGYPLMKDISMIKGRQPESLMECNGFCGPKSTPS